MSNNDGVPGTVSIDADELEQDAGTLSANDTGSAYFFTQNEEMYLRTVGL